MFHTKSTTLGQTYSEPFRYFFILELVTIMSICEYALAVRPSFLLTLAARTLGTVTTAPLARTVADAWAHGFGPQFTANMSHLAFGQRFVLCGHRNGTHEEEGSKNE